MELGVVLLIREENLWNSHHERLVCQYKLRCPLLEIGSRELQLSLQG